MKITLIFPLIMLSFLCSQCTPRTEADTIFHNGKVYTVDSAFSIKEAFAVKDGKILSTGSSEEILRKFKSSNIYDLEGKTVYPGFNDAHCHFYGYGEGLREVNLTGSKSFEEVIQRITEFSKGFRGSWIMGRGWDQNDWDNKIFPDKERLDSLFPEIPVFLLRIDGHAALVNQAALDLAHITPNTHVDGGTFVKKHNKLTGILIDMAIEKVRSVIPPPSSPEIKEAMLQAQENCFSVGLTSVTDAGLENNVIKAIRELNNDSSLKMRIYAMLSPTEENFDEYLRKGIYKTDYLHIASIKLYADGALGSRGAKMKKPYSDDPGNTGLWLTSPENLKKMALLADSFGYQVNTHCIGDQANFEVLKIYSEILKTSNDKRWRIEHAQIVSPEDMDMFGKFNIIPSVQPTHATSDMYWAETRIGEERMRGAYSYKSLLNENGWIPTGSDFPVEDINPLYGFFAAVSRKDKQLKPEGGFRAEESLSREEALKAMTIWAAKAAFEEEEKGSIEAGKFADFVICDRDIMNVPESEILLMKVEETYVGGQRVFKSK